MLLCRPGSILLGTPSLLNYRRIGSSQTYIKKKKKKNFPPSHFCSVWILLQSVSYEHLVLPAWNVEAPRFKRRLRRSYLRCRFSVAVYWHCLDRLGHDPCRFKAGGPLVSFLEDRFNKLLSPGSAPSPPTHTLACLESLNRCPTARWSGDKFRFKFLNLENVVGVCDWRLTGYTLTQFTKAEFALPTRIQQSHREGTYTCVYTQSRLKPSKGLVSAHL